MTSFSSYRCRRVLQLMIIIIISLIFSISAENGTMCEKGWIGYQLGNRISCVKLFQSKNSEPLTKKDADRVCAEQRAKVVKLKHSTELGLIDEMSERMRQTSKTIKNTCLNIQTSNFPTEFSNFDYTVIPNYIKEINEKRVVKFAEKLADKHMITITFLPDQRESYVSKIKIGQSGLEYLSLLEMEYYTKTGEFKFSNYESKKTISHTVPWNSSENFDIFLLVSIIGGKVEVVLENGERSSMPISPKVKIDKVNQITFTNTFVTHIRHEKDCVDGIYHTFDNRRKTFERARLNQNVKNLAKSIFPRQPMTDFLSLPVREFKKDKIGDLQVNIRYFPSSDRSLNITLISKDPMEDLRMEMIRSSMINIYRTSTNEKIRSLDNRAVTPSEHMNIVLNLGVDTIKRIQIVNPSTNKLVSMTLGIHLSDLIMVNISGLISAAFIDQEDVHDVFTCNFEGSKDYHQMTKIPYFSQCDQEIRKFVACSKEVAVRFGNVDADHSNLVPVREDPTTTTTTTTMATMIPTTTTFLTSTEEEAEAEAEATTEAERVAERQEAVKINAGEAVLFWMSISISVMAMILMIGNLVIYFLSFY